MKCSPVTLFGIGEWLMSSLDHDTVLRVSVQKPKEWENDLKNSRESCLENFQCKYFFPSENAELLSIKCVVETFRLQFILTCPKNTRKEWNDLVNSKYSKILTFTLPLFIYFFFFETRCSEFPFLKAYN